MVRIKKNSGAAFSSKFFVVLLLAILFLNCKQHSDDNTPAPPSPPPALINEVDFWLTKSDETIKLQKQTDILAFGTTGNQYANIDVDENSTFQTIDGFGYTLTGGSAEVINSLNASKKTRTVTGVIRLRYNCHRY